MKLIASIIAGYIALCLGGLIPMAGIFAGAAMQGAPMAALFTGAVALTFET